MVVMVGIGCREGWGRSIEIGDGRGVDDGRRDFCRLRFADAYDLRTINN